MIYVISDIHGEYNQFMSLLEKIHFSESDTLYVLGDVVDRGPNPIKTLLYMMNKSNIIPIVGNHEVMAITCLKLLIHEIDRESDMFILEKILDWTQNGGKSTVKEFRELDKKMKQDVIEYIENLKLYKHLKVENKEYILVHSGLDNFSPNKKLEDYTLDELVWAWPDYGKPYYDDIYVVTGHTPTMSIECNIKPGYIFKCNNHIAIDCGASFEGGRLAAICLDTGKEFYSR